MENKTQDWQWENVENYECVKNHLGKQATFILSEKCSQNESSKINESLNKETGVWEAVRWQRAHSKL